MAFKQYAPDRVSVNWNGIRMFGFMSDTFVKVTRDEATFKKEVGAAGDVTRTQSLNKAGMVTLTLMAASPVNDLLSAAMIEDELLGTVVGPLLVLDFNGTTLCEATDAWIEKPADVEFGTDHGGREWVIACAELIMNVGGSTR